MIGAIIGATVALAVLVIAHSTLDRLWPAIAGQPRLRPRRYVLFAVMLAAAATLGAGGAVLMVDRGPLAGVSAASSVSNGRIVFVGSDANGQSQVFTIMPDGSAGTQLTQAAGGHQFPAWSRDGTKIAFTSRRTGTEELWSMAADGSNQTRLTAPPADGNIVPSWSPDGAQIVFASVRTGHPEIWVMNADGGNQRQLTATSAHSNAPSWSPDGSKIAFASNRSGLTEVYTMNPDGSGVQQLTTPYGSSFPDSNVPVWSPDGSRLAFWSGIEAHYGQVWLMNADGSNRQVLTNCSPPANCDDPAWSPDGVSIIFDTNRGGPAETWIMNADGSNQRGLLPFPYGAGRLPWQPVLSSPTPTPVGGIAEAPAVSDQGDARASRGDRTDGLIYGLAGGIIVLIIAAIVLLARRLIRDRPVT